jgi:ABC-2 type transport system permease protein
MSIWRAVNTELPAPGALKQFGQRAEAVLAFAKVGFSAYLAYPAGVAMVFLSYPIIILMYRFVWNAVYAQQDSAGGFTKETMLTYVTVSWLLNTYYMTPTGRNLGAAVREGQVAVDLIKPLNLMGIYLGQSIGRTAFRLVFATVPLLIVFSLTLDLVRPQPLLLLPFFAGLLLGYMINFSLDYMIGLTSFYFGYNQGVRMGIRMVMNLAGGMVIPISYLPEPVARVLKWLPTQFMFYQPVQIFLGRYSHGEAWLKIGEALLWVAALVLLAQWMQSGGMRRLTVSGG